MIVASTREVFVVTVILELVMLLTTKMHVVSGMVIGALAGMAAKQMFKQRRKRKHPGVPAKAQD
tara:strand:- start:358 stop:549 length:192 start_codon:yes stop_codon:yes gene_type:complete